MFCALILVATLGAFSDEAVPAPPNSDLGTYKEATTRSARAPMPMSGWLSGVKRTA